jgi:hypothetical protein
MQNMKRKKVNLRFQEPFNPQQVYNQMLELYNKGINLDYSNQQDARKESKKIRHEMKRLENLRRDYHKDKRAGLKRRQKEVK